MNQVHKPARTATPETSTATCPTTKEVAQAITALESALTRHYGRDFAYTIMGFGNKLAASNMIDGRVIPTSPA